MATSNKVTPLEISMRNLKSAAQGFKSHTSLESSSFSLSESVLNDAIMGMMNIHGKDQSCKKVCQANPLTVSGKRKQMAKMLIIVLLPLTILTVITANDFIISVSHFILKEKLMDRLNFGVELGDFLTALQKERDMSALYVSQIGSDTKAELLLAYPETDLALNKLASWPLSSKNNIKSEFQSRESFINHINIHRYELSIKRVTVSDEVQFYSQDIEMFLRWMYDVIGDAETGSLWKSFVGYQELVMASEYIGRERSYGIYFYAVGSFRDRDAYLLFLESQDIANTYFASAREYSVVAYEIYNDYLEDNNGTLQQINAMRNELRSNNSSQPDGSLSLAKWWFANMSVYREVMRKTQRRLTTSINSLLKESLHDDLISMIIAGGISVCILIISPLIGFSVYMLTNNIQKYSLSIAKKTKALSKEKKRSETVLYQMLPRPIVESLKQNRTVIAEKFEDCTIFQSDMVGFTRLSAQCSPFQVTEMLNCLFSCFDQRIEHYDVYKIETIGDGYMVVSGVPKRNGIRHAAEIATLSLDILFHMKKLVLPHNPEEKYTIRIGCHSGPVLAGVVGSKNPRYCLFGSTVRIASLMESSGEADKIQISETTATRLSLVGGFEMTEREIENVSIKHDLKELGISHKTYWLLKKDVLDWVSESMSFSSASVL